MKVSLSVILCTHNPRPDYFRRVLAALQEQTAPLEEWELLLVDNASERCLVDAWDISWHPFGRHIREDEPGLTPARLRGIRESCGELLVFVDDDNILSPDFLNQALTIPPLHPHLGVFGSGLLKPEFEVEPPRELVPRLSLLALRSVRYAMWSNNIGDSDCIPWGAGLCVTRRVASLYEDLVDKLNVSMFLDRRGKQLFSGGDDIFSWACIGVGQGFGVFPNLRITHLIPAARLNRRYYLRLIHDHAFSHGILNLLLTGKQPLQLGALRYLHLLLHGIRNGCFSMRCQWAGSRGYDRAATFIAAHQLRRVDLDSILRIAPSKHRLKIIRYGGCDLFDGSPCL
jgi:glycosyltransferase involved in cell wall biosynthesis